MPDFNNLEDIFIQVFDLVPMATYVLDGFDAMEEEQCKLLLTFIRSLFSRARELKGQRILLFSRDQIPGYLNIATFIPGIGRTSTFDNTMSDILTYIDYSIGDKSMYRKLTDDRLLLEEIKEVLFNESSGMYVSDLLIPNFNLYAYVLMQGSSGSIFSSRFFGALVSQMPKSAQHCVNCPRISRKHIGIAPIE